MSDAADNLDGGGLRNGTGPDGVGVGVGARVGLALVDQGFGDGANNDSYQHNGGDDENDETLAGLALECLLFHRV